MLGAMTVATLLVSLLPHMAYGRLESLMLGVCMGFAGGVVATLLASRLAERRGAIAAEADALMLFIIYTMLLSVSVTIVITYALVYSPVYTRTDIELSLLSLLASTTLNYVALATRVYREARVAAYTASGQSMGLTLAGVLPTH